MDTITGDPRSRLQQRPSPADLAGRASREEQRERFRLRRTGELTALLEARSELRGVSAVADHLDDAVRWSA